MSVSKDERKDLRSAYFTQRDEPKSSRLLTFIAASCLLWVMGVVAWLVVGGVLEVLG